MSLLSWSFDTGRIVCSEYAEGKDAARIAREAGHDELAAMLEGHRLIEEDGK